VKGALSRILARKSDTNRGKKTDVKIPDAARKTKKYKNAPGSSGFNGLALHYSTPPSVMFFV
jgi:hypothetical protein